MTRDDRDALEPPRRTMTGALRREFHQALLSAFPNVGDFERMLNFGLSVPLEPIAPVRGSFADVVFEVIEWAEANGRVEELIAAAIAEVPGNTALESFVLKWRALPAPDPQPPPAPPPPEPGPSPTPQPPPPWPISRWIAGASALVLIGAAAFWIFLPVKMNGYILYKNSDKTVKGAVVKVPTTGSASMTDDFGFFTLQGPRATQRLYVHVDGNQYEFALVARVGHRYPIVPPVPDAPKALTAAQSTTVEQLVKAQPGRFRLERGAGRHGTLWPIGATIRVAFLDGSAEVRTLVRSIAAEWTKHGNVSFDFEAKPDDSDVRLSFKDPAMSYSYIGTDALAVPKDEPTIVLGAIARDNAPDRESTILHEFGHVLGLVHEYATPAGEKRINFAVVYPKAAKDMGWTKAAVDHNFRQSSKTPDAYDNKPFDPDSVMMARLPSDWFNPPLQIGARTGLSAGDRALIARLYPFQ
jgi:hypothetical protein